MPNLRKNLDLLNKILTTPINKKLLKKILHSKKFLFWAILLSILACSILLRLWNLNAVGRTWDEYAYISTGEQLINLMKEGNFTAPAWYKINDHPPVARYFYGAASFLDKTYYSDGTQSFDNYDWTYTRLVSALFFSFTVIFIVLLGWELSPVIGVISGIIFIMLPVSLGLSQLVTLESPILFFFTGTIYFFTRILKKISLPRIYTTGIFMGLAIGTKLTNVFLVPLLALMFIPWHAFQKRKLQKKLIFLLFIKVYIVALLVFILVWPGMWTHALYIIQQTIATRFPRNAIPNTELFLGSKNPHPLYFFVVYFFVTTPLLIVIFFLLGVVAFLRYKKPLGYMLLLWFFFPFVQSFYPDSTNGIRYIIEIYAPLSLIAAYGFNYIVDIVTKRILIKSLLFIPVIIYLLYTLVSITPYYLSYYNSLVGGPKKVYATKFMPLGWWGEGQKAAGKWLEQNGFPNMTIGLAVMPRYVFYIPNKPESLVDFEDFPSPTVALHSEKYDFIVVNYLYVTTYNFNENLLHKQYVEVHAIYANGAPIVKIYKRKSN